MTSARACFGTPARRFACGLASALAVAGAAVVGGGCDQSSGSAGGGGSSASAAAPDMSAAEAAYATPPSAAIESASQRAAKQPLEVEPAKISLGTVSPCDPPLRTKATIKNRTDAPIAVKRIVSSCACTTAQIVGSRDIGPGESRTVEVQIDISGTGGKSQRIDFAGAKGPIGMLRVDYEIVPPVQATVETVDLGAPSGKADVTVARTDGKPVKLLRLEPSIGEIRTLPDGKQVVTLDVKKADAHVDSEAGQADGTIRRDADGTWTSMYVLVVTDYPGCPNAAVFVRRVR